MMSLHLKRLTAAKHRKRAPLLLDRASPEAPQVAVGDAEQEVAEAHRTRRRGGGMEAESRGRGGAGLDGSPR